MERTTPVWIHKFFLFLGYLDGLPLPGFWIQPVWIGVANWLRFRCRFSASIGCSWSCGPSTPPSGPSSFRDLGFRPSERLEVFTPKWRSLEPERRSRQMEGIFVSDGHPPVTDAIRTVLFFTRFDVHFFSPAHICSV